jgi:D-glycero-beta-D-manno-heptose 1-phosphate adenylyltransferase
MHKIDWVNNKIYQAANLQRQCMVWRAKGQKIVFTNGCFDILHHGHLDYLAKAADMGNVLVVGVNTDASVKRLKGPERPVTNEKDRAFQLASLLCVDAVCLFDEDTPLQLIELLQPNVLVKGGDYTIDNIVGAPFVIQHGGMVQTVPFVSGYSTTAILDYIKKL